MSTDRLRYFDYLPSQFPTWRKWLYYYSSPGMSAIRNYRACHRALSSPFAILRVPFHLFMRRRVMKQWGIEISPKARIGNGFTIQHSGGIAIAGGVRMGDNCRIRHNVTIGYGGKGAREGYPSIGNHVMINPGACVFGNITIGNHVTIGANAVVSFDVPDNAVVGAPMASIIKTEGGGARPAAEGGDG